MTARIESLTKSELGLLISQQLASNLNEKQVENLNRCVKQTTTVWGGWADNELLCVFGLVPPTLISPVAWMWLHTTDAVKDNEFVFVRHSQVVIQKALELYPEIVGHTELRAERSKRWLRWLGAKFGEPEGGYIPFSIRAKHG